MFECHVRFERIFASKILTWAVAVTYNATDMVELKRKRLFEVSTRSGRYTRKNTVFDYFFHKLTKRITSESDTAGKMGPTCCPTIRSTGINPQLVMPVRYKALTVLQFWIFLVLLRFSEVETSESFSRLW